MAFKFKTFAAVGALIGSLALVGCGQDEKDPNHIKVGVIVGAEQQVAEVAQKVAKEKYGLDVELVTFNDYVLPNEALSKGDIDANAFQHKPYRINRSKIAATNWLPQVILLFTRLRATLKKSNHWMSCRKVLRSRFQTIRLTLAAPCCCCKSGLNQTERRCWSAADRAGRD